MDLPAPVSPVMMFNPATGSNTMCLMMAKFDMVSLLNN
jgi:hypothetical protein